MFKQIGKNIRVLRKKENISQEKLSNKLNISRQQVVNYESGDTTIPLKKMAEISEIFNVSIDFLIRINLSSYSDIELMDILKGEYQENSTMINSINNLQNNNSILLLNNYFTQLVKEQVEPIEDLLRKVLTKMDSTDLKYELAEAIKKANMIIGDNHKQT